MTDVQLFGVMVRTFGLVSVIAGAISTFESLISLLGPTPGAAAVALVVAVAALVFGFWLLRGAKSLVAFAYPGEQAAAKPAATVRSDG
jgi:uncharacterized membrane protein HdeD (DUF308 family)